MRNNSGFTLIELIMVIVILGILAVVAVPRFIDLREQAFNAAEEGVAAAVAGGIQIAHAENLVNSSLASPSGGGTWSNVGYPADLDGEIALTNASSANPLFAYVLEQGVTDSRWQKVNATTYRFFNATGNVTYTYTNSNGVFTKP